MSLFIPKSRKTIDPKYKEAKKNLRSYQVSCDKYLQSMKSLSSHVLQISKVYSQFSSTVTAWYPDSTAAVRQSMDSINQSATNFAKITTDNFVNSVDANFGSAMKEYQKHINSLLSLEKKRRSAVKEYDREREKLRQAESAKNPDQNKIDRAQTQVDATGETYNKLNDEYITSVNQFGEERKTTLLSTFKKCCSVLCNYINQATTINFVQFPEDINSKPKENQLKQDLDSIKVLNENNTFTDQQSNQINQSVSTSNLKDASTTNTNTPSAVARLNSTPSPAAKRLSRRISDCEYQQKRKSSSIAQPINPNYNENSESFSTVNQVQKPQPATVSAQTPRPAQKPSPAPIPVQRPKPIPVKPTPIEQPSPTPIEQPSPAPVDQPSPAPAEQPSPAPVEQPSSIQKQSSQSSSSSMNSDSLYQENPPSIPTGSTVTPAASTTTTTTTTTTTNNNAEPWYSSTANLENDTEWHVQSSEQNNENTKDDKSKNSPDDDTYSHVNPFGSGDDNDEDEDYTRENPFS